MNVETLKVFLMWSTGINYAILLLWIVLLSLAPEMFYKMQSRWFPIPKEKLVMCNYLMYGLYKLMVLIFNFVPWLVLSLLF